jgi:peptidase M48-like protein
MTERRLLVHELAAGALAATVALAMTAVSVDALRFHRDALVPTRATGLVLLAVLAAQAATLLRFAAALTREAVRTRRFRRALGGEPRTLHGARVTVLAERTPRAFCAGLLRPRIYVSTGLLATLSPAQLRSVIAHERRHAIRRDPLRCALAGALCRALWFVPSVRAARWTQAAAADLAADAAAIAAAGVRPLAAALLVFEEAGSGPSPQRLEQLLGRRPATLGWPAPAAAAVAVALAAGVAWLALGGPAVCLPLSELPSALAVLGLLALACLPASRAGRAAAAALRV